MTQGSHLPALRGGHLGAVEVSSNSSQPKQVHYRLQNRVKEVSVGKKGLKDSLGFDKRIDQTDQLQHD